MQIFKTITLIAAALVAGCQSTFAQLSTTNLPPVTDLMVPNDDVIVNHFESGVKKTRRIPYSTFKEQLGFQPYSLNLVEWATVNPSVAGLSLAVLVPHLTLNTYPRIATNGGASLLTPAAVRQDLLGVPSVNGWVLYSLTDGTTYWNPPGSIGDLPPTAITVPNGDVVIKEDTGDGLGDIPRLIPLSQNYDTGAQVANVRAFGASGSEKSTTMSAVSNANSPVLFITDGASGMNFRVGQGVWVATGGVAGAPYVGTVIYATPGSDFIGVTPVHPTSIASGVRVEHDDTAAIQAAINSTIHGGGSDQEPASNKVYFPPGDYRCSSQLTLAKRTHLIGSGRDFYNGTKGTLLKWPDLASGIGIYCDGENMGIEEMTIRGPGSTDADADTTGVYGVSYGMEIQNVSVDYWGRGIHHYASPALHTKVTIDQCNQDCLLLQEVPGFTSIGGLYQNSVKKSAIHLMDKCTWIHFYDPSVDENGGLATVQIDAGSDISFNNMTILTSRGIGLGGGYGFRFGNGTTTPTRVHLNNIYVQQYETTTNWTVKNIYIRGSGHTLTNVVTLKPTGFSGDDIQDDSTDSRWYNVNGKYKLRLETSSAAVNSGEIYSNSGVMTVKP